jgi:cell division protein FtsL
MKRVSKINQAYDQTPWRKQLQWIGSFLVILVVFALIAGIYLNVNARAATIGREIQNYHLQIDELENTIADQQSQLALLTSAAEMEGRALDMGFRYANSDEILYLVVEGYNGRTPAVLAVESNTFVSAIPTSLSPAFSQSLFDWLRSKLSLTPEIIERVKP